MKQTFVALAVGVIMAATGLAGHLQAAENIALKAVAAGQPGVLTGAPDQNNTSEEEVRAEEAKKSAAMKKAAEEAKKVVVAKVNGVGIDMFMLTRAMNRVAPKYAREGEGMTPEITAKIKGDALQKMIIEELAVQEAIRQGIGPAPGAVGKVVEQVRKNLGSEEAYRGYLDKSFLTEDVLRQLIERSQRLELITAKEVYGKVKVDEQLLREEYEKEKAKYVLPENFAVTDVWFLKGKDETTREKAGVILETIRRSGNDPGKTTLDGTFVVRKITVRKERYPEIYKAMTDISTGGLSGIIGEKDGYHIVKVTRKEPSRPATFEEARPTIEPKFLYPAQEARRQEWEKGLREKAKVEILMDDADKVAAKPPQD